MRESPPEIIHSVSYARSLHGLNCGSLIGGTDAGELPKSSISGVFHESDTKSGRALPNPPANYSFLLPYCLFKLRNCDAIFKKIKQFKE